MRSGRPGRAEVAVGSMLFSVEYDIGSAIKAYLVPDAGGASARGVAWA